ncbi:putative G alpha chain [Fusarium denticulatum]|uniref:Putative G alpha chain n=1 Tax=Fusarium denticulatum TaxID=48507 RepID=A0A8H5TSB7_9HYPO|nr:putative G alpha chain [Fusarium denticulatum]
MQSSDGSIASHDPMPEITHSDVDEESDYDSFIKAINDNDVTKVESLLASDPKLQHASYELTVTTEDSEIANFSASPLAVAVACHCIPVVQYFLSHAQAVDIDRPTHTEGWSALHFAARYDYQDSLSLLLGSNLNVNQPDKEGMSPLHLASRYGHLGVAKNLIDKGADIVSRDAQRHTPFHMASMYGQDEVLKLLWDKGPSTQISDENCYAFPALQLAVMNDRCNVVPLLLDFGANISQGNGEHKKTPLHTACANLLPEMVQLLLEKGADIHAKDKYLNTPLMQSCFDPHPGVFNLLRNEGALTTELNIHRRTGFHAVVLSERPFDQMHRDVVALLVGLGVDINQRDIFGFSPLFHACKEQKPDMIKLLLDFSADIDQKTTAENGLTALMEACCESPDEPVDILLRRGAKLDPTNPHGLTALTLACLRGHLNHVDRLIREGADVATPDRDGHTAICIAARKEHTNIVLSLLGSPRYYPQYPADSTYSTDQRIFLANGLHDKEIEENLMHAVENDLHKTLSALHVIMYWAVAHGRIKLVDKCISHNPEVLSWEREGATWLDVAAQHAQYRLINKRFSEFQATKEAAGKVTPLHLAVGSDSFGTVSCLLKQIGTQSLGHSAKAMTTAIFLRDVHGASPLSISIHRKHTRITELFWTTIQELGEAEKRYLLESSSDALRILETLAQYEKPGNEKVLEYLLQQWCTNQSLTEKDKLSNPLDWAVYCSQPVVVWWLLSKEGYLSGRAIDNAKDLVQYSDPGTKGILVKLLQHPLPALGNIANPNADPIPELPKPRNGNDPGLALEGIIVDIVSDGNVRSARYSNATTKNIIYDSGPDEIMKNSANLDHWDLNSLKRKIVSPVQESGTIGDLLRAWCSETPGSTYTNDGRPLTRLGKTVELRWIHLPVTELTSCLPVVAIHARRSAMDHQSLMRYFERSWTDLAAGGGQHYMKPRCVRNGRTYSKEDFSAIAEGSSVCTALYMPYVTLGCYRPPTDPEKICGKENGKPKDIEDLQKQSGSHRWVTTAHEPMTLDQYYYPTLIDTDWRDKDQVLSKYLTWKSEKLNKKPSQEQGQGTTTGSTEKDVEQKSSRILMVDQIWMWIIDESMELGRVPCWNHADISPETIITASTETTPLDERSRDSLLRTVLDRMIYDEGQDTFDHPKSAHSMMELTLGVATGFFDRKFVPLPTKLNVMFKTPLEVFREYLRHAADREVYLYQVFLRELNKTDRQRKKNESHVNSVIKSLPFHPYSSLSNPRSISPEAALLSITRDIHDELHMLKSLAEDQELVWKQAFENRQYFQYHHPYIPTNVKKDIEDMLVELTLVQVNTLLDLRQKQATITQANDTAKQSNTIFVFTIITIVFLPLSFLSSLFALDVASFPHESGDLKYQGWWLFPILFGASAVVSLPTIFLAWKVNAISDWFRRPRERDLKKTTDHQNDDQEADEQRGEDLRDLAGRTLLRGRKAQETQKPSSNFTGTGEDSPRCLKLSISQGAGSRRTRAESKPARWWETLCSSSSRFMTSLEPPSSGDEYFQPLQSCPAEAEARTCAIDSYLAAESQRSKRQLKIILFGDELENSLFLKQTRLFELPLSNEERADVRIETRRFVASICWECLHIVDEYACRPEWINAHPVLRRVKEIVTCEDPQDKETVESMARLYCDDELRLALKQFGHNLEDIERRFLNDRFPHILTCPCTANGNLSKLLERVFAPELHEYLILFDSLANSRWLTHTPFFVILSNVSAFRRKIVHSPLSKWFPQYKGGSTGDAALEFMKDQFRELAKAEQNVYIHASDIHSADDVMAAIETMENASLSKVLKELDMPPVECHN